MTTTQSQLATLVSEVTARADLFEKALKEANLKLQQWKRERRKRKNK